jgi:hypothetical protein
MATAVVLFVGVLGTLSHAAKAPRGGREGPPREESMENAEFAVVQIGSERIDVVPSTGVTGLKQSAAQEDKQRQKAYDDAKKASRTKSKSKVKRDPSDPHAPVAPTVVELPPKPTKRKVTVLKDHIKSMGEAEELRFQYLREGRLDQDSKKTPAR